MKFLARIALACKRGNNYVASIAAPEDSWLDCRGNTGLAYNYPSYYQVSATPYTSS